MTDPTSNRELPDHLETASGPGGGRSNRATQPAEMPLEDEPWPGAANPHEPGTAKWQRWEEEHGRGIDDD